MLILILLIFAAGFGFLAYRVLYAEHDPAVWHVDPLTAPPQPTPNGFRVAPAAMSKFPPDAEAPVYGASAEVLAQALDDFVLAQLYAERIAGSPDNLWMTYVQRTPTLRIPDYISVKLVPLADDRSTIAVFSRSRFGYGDMGVNEKRVRGWLATLGSFEVEPIKEVETPTSPPETAEEPGGAAATSDGAAAGTGSQNPDGQEDAATDTGQ
ncbi:MAG: DUF1499 domain-containing protein [Paracoccaceae bacterium]